MRHATVVFAMIFSGLVLAPASSAREEKVNIDKVPAPVIEKVRSRFRGATLTEAAREQENGRLVYEVTLVQGGQDIDATLTPDGEMLTIERRIPAEELPASVTSALAEAYPGAGYRTTEEIYEVHGAEEHLDYYEILLDTGNGRLREVRVAPDGVILAPDEDDDEDEDSD